MKYKGILKHNKAQVALETVIAVPIMVIIVFGLIVSSMSYFATRGQAIQANYDVGRFVSQMGYCNSLASGTSGSLAGLLVTSFVNERNYKITIVGGGTRTLTPSNSDKYKTDVTVYCPPSWARTASFKVTATTTSPIDSGLNFFPTTFNSENYFMVEYGEVE